MRLDAAGLAATRRAKRMGGMGAAGLRAAGASQERRARPTAIGCADGDSARAGPPSPSGAKQAARSAPTRQAAQRILSSNPSSSSKLW